MIAGKQKTVLIAVTLTGLVLLAIWNFNWMTQKRAGAETAVRDLNACKEVGREIETLRQKSVMASSEAGGVKEVGERIESAKRQANLTEAAFRGIYPQEAHPLNDSSYLQKSTSLELQGVSLGQLVTFLYYVSEGSGLTVRDLRLRSPRNDLSHDLWDAEVTLTYLIYSPSVRRGDGIER